MMVAGFSMLGQYTRVRQVAGAALSLALSHDGRGDIMSRTLERVFFDGHWRT